MTHLIEPQTSRLKDFFKKLNKVFQKLSKKRRPQ